MESKINDKSLSFLSSKGQFYVIFALIILLASPAFIGLWGIWSRNVAFRGLLLVPFMAALLFYKVRDKLRIQKLAWNYKSLVLLSMSLVAMVVLANTGLVRLSGYCFFLSLFWLFSIAFSARVKKYWLRPLGFLVLMIPMPLVVFNSGESLLQSLFSQVIDAISPALSSDIFIRDGNVFYFEKFSKPIIIADECAGLRSMTGLVIVSLFLSILDEHNRVVMWLFLLSAILMSLTLNLLRIVVSLELRFVGMERYAIGKWHELLGAAVFIVGYLLLSRLSKAICKQETAEFTKGELSE